jgi:hypothetical protein
MPVGGLIATLAVLVSPAAPTSVAPAQDHGSPAGPSDDHSASSRATRWNGTYAFVGGDDERSARMRAIERATEDLMFIGRGIARRRLRENTEPYERIRIEVGSRAVTMITDVQWTTPVDGSPRRLRDAEGDTYRVSTHFDDDRLVQTVRDDSLRNVNTFRLSEGGRRMRMHVHIEHDRLPRDVEYHLTYRRR